MKQYKPKEFAEMLNVSVKTLQRWDNEGVLKAYRNPKGRRYYTEEQYREYMGIPKENQVGKTVIYARVSDRSQKDDLENQVEFLRTFANARGIIIDEILTDVGSGLNYKRKQWNRLMEQCVEGNISTILIAHQDRFVRFGYEWFEQFLAKHGVKIMVINNEKLSPQEEFVQDLISIIEEFSCRVYGLRKYRDKMKEDRL
ncbi:putative site-specific integrase-resolvase [Anoxybacillus tepidamans]|uniref:Putative site-specific integrase-resolvase n=1 Tax=Anoxybacteroides tepidamans TaxID=265948 RepID=A0A7W8ISA4_9BACL|nr:IS607 family transposase [Anoxybacillus tepidamans]MBB5324804.1 putative site-specific integrase-resolvase [Anoxybacillus tepidamans]